MVYLVLNHQITARWLSGLLVLVFILVFSQAEAANRRHKLRYQQTTRYYFVHIPPQKLKRYALVINLHGGGGQGRGQEEFSDMDKTADKYGFYVVYPNGTGKLHDRLLSWNAGNCCGYAYAHHIDDVGFIRGVLDAVIKRYPIDPHRVYVTGMSNGAMMAYYLAEKLPRRIAAIAPVAGARMPDSTNSSKPMPIMYFHSLTDPRAPYHGGIGSVNHFTNQQGSYPDVDAVLAAWARINGCQAQRKQIANREEKSKKVLQTAREYRYQDCKRAPLVLWQLDQVGHVWPGGRQHYMQRLLGPSTRVINANEEMWHFFERFRVR